jgi:hypothetical protein
LCLDRGANINAVTDKGQTALQGASLRGADTLIAWLMSHGAKVNAKDKIVQTFSAKVSALGTSTGGLSPSVPANLACEACSGTLTATSSAPWLIITSIGGGSIRFNVFSNTSSSSRTGVIQVEGASNKVTVTIEEAGSTAPVLDRQVTYLYQHILGREPDASGFALWTGPSDTGAPSVLGRMTADLLNSAEAQDSDVSVMAMFQAINGSAPDYATWLAALQALRNGSTAQAQFAAILGSSSCGRGTQATFECLYGNMLGRGPTSGELTAALAAQPFKLFTGLLTSPEFRRTRAFAKDYSNPIYVTMLYYLILERPPNPSELADASNSAGLTGSAEFLARFQ